MNDEFRNQAVLAIMAAMISNGYEPATGAGESHNAAMARIAVKKADELILALKGGHRRILKCGVCFRDFIEKHPGQRCPVCWSSKVSERA